MKESGLPKVQAFDREFEDGRQQRLWRARAASLREQREFVRQEISVVETVAADAVAAAGFVVVAADREDRWAEEGNVPVGPGGSLVLGEGTSLEEEDRRTEEEDHWGSREDQQEDQSESFPVEVGGEPYGGNGGGC